MNTPTCKKCGSLLTQQKYCWNEKCEYYNKPQRMTLTGRTRKAKAREFYATTFCNFAHDVKTGRPIGHECYILPPSAIQAEREGDMDKAIDILQTKGKGPIVRGRKA